jgi:hypothetical protein
VLTALSHVHIYILFSILLPSTRISSAFHHDMAQHISFMSAFRYCKTPQVLSAFFVVVLLSLFLLIQQQSVGNIYREFKGPSAAEELESTHQHNIKRARFFKNNRRYNLMGESGSEVFYNYDAKDCTLGDYISTDISIKYKVYWPMLSVIYSLGEMILIISYNKLFWSIQTI